MALRAGAFPDDLTILKDPQLVAMALGLIAIASIGKFTGAFIGGEIVDSPGARYLHWRAE